MVCDWLKELFKPLVDSGMLTLYRETSWGTTSYFIGAYLRSANLAESEEVSG